MASKLYERHNYLNKDIEYIISSEIIEYDIKSAGFNLIKENKLVDEKIINEIEKMNKKERQIKIGLLQREDSDLKEKLNKAFVEIRRRFIEANKLEDEDILSIKKDAIITLRKCHKTIFGGIEFIEKNKYTSYLYLNKMEFYIGKDKVDVKGISDELLELHKEYMLDFIYNFTKTLETSERNYSIKVLMDFARYYKERELQAGYYRELSKDSFYRYKDTIMDFSLGIKNVDDVYDIDISYNYMHYIIPLMNILV